MKKLPLNYYQIPLLSIYPHKVENKRILHECEERIDISVPTLIVLHHEGC